MMRIFLTLLMLAILSVPATAMSASPPPETESPGGPAYPQAPRVFDCVMQPANIAYEQADVVVVALAENHPNIPVQFNLTPIMAWKQDVPESFGVVVDGITGDAGNVPQIVAGIHVFYLKHQQTHLKTMPPKVIDSYAIPRCSRGVPYGNGDRDVQWLMQNGAPAKVGAPAAEPVKKFPR